METSVELFTLANLVALITLTSLEIVLGIDNIVFIAIIAGRLKGDQKNKARLVGLSIAVVTRVLLLLVISWMASLTTPLFSFAILEKSFSGRDLILIGGGLFLIWKATKEIHNRTASDSGSMSTDTISSFTTVVIQIVLIDIVFSLDSVITAVGMTNNLPVMITAVVLAIGVMMVFSGKVVEFIDENPTIKMLALTFLLLIGFVLVAEGWGKHIEKGYIYFAMAFSLGVELLNIRAQKNIKA